MQYGCSGVVRVDGCVAGLLCLLVVLCELSVGLFRFAREWCVLLACCCWFVVCGSVALGLVLHCCFGVVGGLLWIRLLV